MSFETFAADNPYQIVIGLFSGELQAVYMFCQTANPTVFESHFTSSRKANKTDVLAGAQRLVEWFRENHQQIVAFVSQRNTPLRRFVEQFGLTEISTGQSDTEGLDSPSTAKLFVEYRS